MLTAGLIAVLLALFVVGIVIGDAVGQRRSRPKPHCPCGRYQPCAAYVDQQQRAQFSCYQPCPCGPVPKPEPKKSDSTEHPLMRGYGKPPKSK